MAEVIELLTIQDDPEKVAAAVTQVVDSLRRGEVIVCAIEHAYVYACDAFHRDAVAKLHSLRGDDYGVAAQVMVGSAETLEGIAADVTDEMRTLIERFWPGLLTVHAQPHYGLNWDLGDGGELGEFAVRIPARSFLHEVLKQSGPLAVASAALAGRPPVRDIGAVSALYSDIGFYVDEGTLEPGPASTVVQQKIIGGEAGLEMLREGAVTFEQLQEALPSISRANP